jgi:hypothetical protein
MTSLISRPTLVATLSSNLVVLFLLQELIHQSQVSVRVRHQLQKPPINIKILKEIYQKTYFQHDIIKLLILAYLFFGIQVDRSCYEDAMPHRFWCEAREIEKNEP